MTENQLLHAHRVIGICNVVKRLKLGQTGRNLDGEIMFYLFAKPVTKTSNSYIWPEDNPSWIFAHRRQSPVSDECKKNRDETIEFQFENQWILMNSLRVPPLTTSLDAVKTLQDKLFNVSNLVIASKREETKVQISAGLNQAAGICKDITTAWLLAVLNLWLEYDRM